MHRNVSFLSVFRNEIPVMKILITKYVFLFAASLMLLYAFSMCVFKRNQTAADYKFLPVDSLQDNPVMPDPFKKPDGTRVGSLEEWPEQRTYLKALLQYYLYGHVPPKPTKEELSLTRLSDDEFIPPGSSVKGRKQVYRVTINRNSLSHSFHFNLWRPEGKKRYPTLINNYMRPQSTQPDYSWEEGVRRGYMVVVFHRKEVAPDEKENADRSEGIFPLYPEYDFFTIAAWAWAYQVIIDVLDELEVIDIDKIIVTGHSRGGQTAMAAGIFDERIDMVAPSTGGPWSVGSFRQRDPEDYRGTMDYGELIKGGFPHWYHPRFIEFIGKQNKMPFDSPTLIALVAPRPLLNLNAVGDGINNGLAHEAGIRAGIRIYEWMDAGNWCRIHWRDTINQYGQTGHDQGPEEYNAVFDYADEYFFNKKGRSSYNSAPGTDTWRYNPDEYPLLIDWEIPGKK